MLYHTAIHYSYLHNDPKYSNRQALANSSWAVWSGSTLFEPPHDKTNKMNVRPAKTQIRLGIRPVWSESLLCAQWVAKDPSFLQADSEDSDQTGRMAQADLSLRWAHMPFCWFCHEVAHLPFCLHNCIVKSDCPDFRRITSIFSGVQIFSLLWHHTARLLDWKWPLLHYDNWGTPRENVSSGIFEKVRFKPACSATEAS